MAAAAPSALINVKGVYGSKSFEYGLVKLTPSRCSPSNNAWKQKSKLYGHMSCKQQVRARAEYYGGSRRGNVTGDFVAGLLLGGAIFGTLGYVFAPQISRSLLSFDRSTFTLEELEDWWLRRKLPKSLIDDKDLMITRKSLNDKIDELNAAIDEVAGQLKSGQVPKSEQAPSQKDSAPPDVTNAAHC